MPALIGVIFLWVHMGDLCCVISQALPILERCYFRFFFPSDLVNCTLIPAGACILEFNRASLNSDKAAYCNSVKLTVAGYCIIIQGCQYFNPPWVAKPKTQLCTVHVSVQEFVRVPSYLLLGMMTLWFWQKFRWWHFCNFSKVWKSIYLKEYLEGICIQYFSAAFRVVRPT